MYWYALVGVLAISVLIIENFDILFSSGDSQRFPKIKAYRRFLYGIMAYYITDVLWGLLDSLRLYSLLYLDTVVYYVAMAVGVLFWTQYVVTYLGEVNTFSRFLSGAGRFCFAAVITITVVNYFTPVLFWFDENGTYHASPLRHAQLVFQIILLIQTSVYALRVIQHSDGAIKKRYQTICMFGLVVALLLLLQLPYPFLPLYTIGYMLGSCLLRAFVVSNEMDELLQQQSERIYTELKQAAKIQASFLPHIFPPFPDRNEFELFASMVPAKNVGGDFYDYFFVDNDHLALVMADVSGKGIPAAMFMADTKNKIRSAVRKHGSDVAAAVREANIELCDGNDEGLFVTVWLGVLTVSTGHMDYVDAGHEYPAISRNGGEFVAEEDVHCAPVAARKKTKFEAGDFDLKAGDILYLYTDGVTEANNSAGEMFRRGRMLEVLNRSVNSTVEDIDSAIRGALAEFVQDEPQFDDTTMMVFRYKGLQ
ncbi:MAG: PP2C family protein-serine/threonine phosphatase [Lachnospiraceae bacterium]|nr:PP2C family protein-serine/threonine phosphatase [Lachnospiraceae bacterium]